MKRKLIFIVLYAATIISAVYAQNPEPIVVTGSRFTYPLLERWIVEFNKQYPDVQFKINARKSFNEDSASLIINAHELGPEEIRQGYTVVNIVRYAILPVANSKSPLIEEFGVTGIKEKKLKNLFFKKYDPLEEAGQKQSKPDKAKYSPVLYTRLEKACAPTTFARNFGFEQQDILGKQIGGDDKHLITAIQRDTNGLTYNNLGFIYDLETRTVKQGLAVLPVDINNNGKLDENESFYNSLDEIIERLEKKNISSITTGYINISYAPKDNDDTNKNLILFIKWILESGQQYNHEYGFLNIEKDYLSKQKNLLDHSLN